MRSATFVVVGGGIAGVTCAETLAFLEPDESILLISESALIKTVTNLIAITKTITTFDVKEENFNSLSCKYKNVNVIHDKLIEIDDEAQEIKTLTSKIKYKFLCLCMGAEPKIINCKSDKVLGIRDTDSVEVFVQKLSNCKKIAIVGNGGIASELVYKIQNTEIDWVIKDKHISATFVDCGAAEFFQGSVLRKDLNSQKENPKIVKRMRYSESGEEINKSGAALGPDWYKNFLISGSNEGGKSAKIHYEAEVAEIIDDSNKLTVKLTNNETINCDLIVSATGVQPRSNFISKSPFSRSEDGGLLVDEYMRTNLKNIYAAGDICTPNWSLAKHWFPMKLWTQARQMGCYAAKTMSAHSKNEEILQDFCFEIFTHSTKLFGFKVILLGLFNGQKLGNNYELLVRNTPGMEYVKFVMEENKLQGAVLVGDTDLEEMAENLILNQLDLSPYGEDLLNPDIDIEDYFD